MAVKYVLKTPTDFVHLSGDETIYGNKTFGNNVTIVGNLYVSGTTVSKSDLNITSNFITINSGETGSGVTLGESGIRIDREHLFEQKVVDEARFIPDAEPRMIIASCTPTGAK